MIRSMVDRIASLFRWWFAQIARQDTFRAKAIVGCAGLLVLCVVCSIPVTLISVQSKLTWRPKSARRGS